MSLATIGQKEYQAAYVAAKAVFRDEISEQQAADQLSADVGMALGSAYDYVRVLGLMLEGKRYTRTINDAATRFYLDRILADFGSESLRSALQALNLHIEYYEKAASTKRPALRAIASDFSLKVLGYGTDFADDFEREVAAALQLPPKVLAQSLPAIGSKPTKRLISSSVFERNPIVVAAALQRANGSCERCSRKAPFLSKKTGQPFLEVHHVVTLARGGNDTLQNALAICPNCHRELHYG